MDALRIHQCRVFLCSCPFNADECIENQRNGMLMNTHWREKYKQRLESNFIERITRVHTPIYV